MKKITTENLYIGELGIQCHIDNEIVFQNYPKKRYTFAYKTNCDEYKDIFTNSTYTIFSAYTYGGEIVFKPVASITNQDKISYEEAKKLLDYYNNINYDEKLNYYINNLQSFIKEYPDKAKETIIKELINANMLDENINIEEKTLIRKQDK